MTYDFNEAFMLLEPALLVATFLLLFLVAIVASRVDLTIAKDERWRAAQVRISGGIGVHWCNNAPAGEMVIGATHTQLWTSCPALVQARVVLVAVSI